jgi:hypothetical protein
MTCSSLLSAKPAREKSQTVQHDEQNYGKPNPNAPEKLSRFAFLIGKWAGQAKLKGEDGHVDTLDVTWEGRYILDGYAIEDEYRMATPSGELIVLGMNFRAYDPKKNTWNMKWLNALTGTWVDLGSEELGGFHIDAKEISYIIKETAGDHAFTRATYTNIDANHFTWLGEKSSDNKTWQEFLLVDLHR